MDSILSVTLKACCCFV